MSSVNEAPAPLKGLIYKALKLKIKKRTHMGAGESIRTTLFASRHINHVGRIFSYTVRENIDPYLSIPV